MIKFIIKGILRDKSKSIIPIAVISVGVMVTVMMSGFLEGVFSDVINQNAKLDTGHVKIMTKPYAENKEQLPNDLALLEINELIDSLNLNFGYLNENKHLGDQKYLTTKMNLRNKEDGLFSFEQKRTVKSTFESVDKSTISLINGFDFFPFLSLLSIKLSK